MNLDDLIIAAFCETDDAMNACVQQLPKACLRERGSMPTVCDSEVLCMELVGAYLGLEQDQAIYEHCVRHYSHFFPALSRVHRTTFTRQATNLSHFKERLWQHWLTDTPRQRGFGLMDSLPVPLCRFARATFYRRFRYEDARRRSGSARHLRLRPCGAANLLGTALASACRLARTHHPFDFGSGS